LKKEHENACEKIQMQMWNWVPNLAEWCFSSEKLMWVKHFLAMEMKRKLSVSRKFVKLKQNLKKIAEKERCKSDYLWNLFLTYIPAKYKLRSANGNESNTRESIEILCVMNRNNSTCNFQRFRFNGVECCRVERLFSSVEDYSSFGV
jgi:hypothetical protein